MEGVDRIQQGKADAVLSPSPICAEQLIRQLIDGILQGGFISPILCIRHIRTLWRPTDTPAVHGVWDEVILSVYAARLLVRLGLFWRVDIAECAVRCGKKVMDGRHSVCSHDLIACGVAHDDGRGGFDLVLRGQFWLLSNGVLADPSSGHVSDRLFQQGMGLPTR